MPHVVTDACIKCKFTECVSVCPVDCFYEGETMLAINPDECIDCGVCIPLCPTKAIINDLPEEANKWLEINAEYSSKWPKISSQSKPLEDAKKWVTVKNKYESQFSPNPAKR